MKKTKIFAVILCVFILACGTFGFSVSAAGVDNTAEKAEELFGFSEREILDRTGAPNVKIDDLKDISFTDAIKYIVDGIKEEIVEPVKVLSLLCGIFILFSMASAFGEKRSMISSDMVCSALTAYTVCRVITPAAESFFRYTSAMTAFLKAVCPAVSVMTAVSGKASGALAYKLGVTAGTEILTFICSDVIFYGVYAFLAVCVCCSLSPYFDLSGIVSLCERFVCLLLGITGTVFTGFLSVKKVFGSAADTLALRGIKFAAGNFIPIVGGVVSDGLSSVFAGVQAVQSGVCIWSLVIMFIMALKPLALFIAWGIVLRAADCVRGMLCPNIKGASLGGFISFIRLMCAGTVFILFIGTVCTLMLFV